MRFPILIAFASVSIKGQSLALQHDALRGKSYSQEPFAKPSKISDFIPLNGFFFEFSPGNGHLPSICWN